MPSDLPRFTFRTNSETLEKLRFIADNNFRTLNKELEMLVNQYIADYETKNGDIKITKE